MAMLKKFIIITFISVSTLSANAQYVFDQADMAFNVGVGLISVDGLVPTFNLSAELGLIPTGDFGVISAGGDFEYKYSRLNGLNYNQFTLGPRAAWHLHSPFLEKSNWDIYTGLGFGFRFHSIYNSISQGLDPKIGMYMQAFIGGRMMLDDNFGIFTEIGGGAISALKAGIVYRL